MTQLTKGIYGGEFGQVRDGPFGLHCGQMCGGSDKITHNSGWYNTQGEKLGFGDLSVKDFLKISQEIDPDEVFIILSESKSYWDLKDSQSITEAPGVGYVTENAMHAITRGRIMRVDHYGFEHGPGIFCGMNIEIVSEQELKELLLAKTTK